MLAVVIAYPTLITDRLDKAPKVNLESIRLEVEPGHYGKKGDADPLKALTPQPAAEKTAQEPAGAPKEEDPMEAVKRALEQDAKKK
jgi:hypothetical protein